MKIKIVYSFYILLFFFLYVFALNFNYIEGDDARTILYHVFGRDADFQPPYSPYHSMLDTVLSLIKTTNETVLRTFAIFLSFLFGLLSLIFMAKILAEKFVDKKAQLVSVLVLIPFIIPDILFNSFIINPTIISFAIILLSHIFLLKYLKNNKIFYFILSVIFFGFGVSFRWSNGFYLFVLFGYFILNDTLILKELVSYKRLKKSLVLFPFYVISVIVFIQISGYSIIDIFKVFAYGTSYMDDKEHSLLSLASAAIPFVTPALVLLFLMGMVYCIRTRLYMPIALLILALVPYVVLGIVPIYKYVITVVVPLLVILIYGYLSITNKALKIGIYLIIFIPWFFGIQIESNSAWGPGFEVKAIQNNDINAKNFNPDKSTSIEHVKVVFGSGMAVPTSEGPRCLYGFGQVVFKNWNRFLSDNNLERELAVNYAIENNCNILQDVNHSFIASKLCEQGYDTKDRLNASNNMGVHRTFTKNSSQVSIDVLENKKALFNRELMEAYLIKNKQVVVYSSYTNIITKLKATYKLEFEQKGAYWGVLKQ